MLRSGGGQFAAFTRWEKIKENRLRPRPGKVSRQPKRHRCQRCVRTQQLATASSRGLGETRRRLPLMSATTNDDSTTASFCPRRRPLSQRLRRLWRAARRARSQSRHRSVRQGAARDKRWSCYSTDATDAPNRQARRSTHNSALKHPRHRRHISLRDCVCSMAWIPSSRGTAYPTIPFRRVHIIAGAFHVVRLCLVPPYTQNVPVVSKR